MKHFFDATPKTRNIQKYINLKNHIYSILNKIKEAMHIFSDFGGETLLKLRCDERFKHAFTACGSVFKVITLVCSNQGNDFENATACSKRMLKTTVATHL